MDTNPSTSLLSDSRSDESSMSSPSPSAAYASNRSSQLPSHAGSAHVASVQNSVSAVAVTMRSRKRSASVSPMYSTTPTSNSRAAMLVVFQTDGFTPALRSLRVGP